MALVKGTRPFALGALVVGSISGVLVVIGAVLPWSTVTVGIFVGGRAGDAIDVIGMIALGVLVVAGALMAGLSGQPHRAVYLLMLCLALVSIQAGFIIVAIHRLSDAASSLTGGVHSTVSPGVGAYLMIAGGLLTATAIALVTQTSYGFKGVYGVVLGLVAVVGFSVVGGLLARSSALPDLSDSADVSASPQAATPNSQSASSSFDETKSKNAGAAFSEVVKGNSAQWAATASGHVLHVYEWNGVAWNDAQDVQLDVAVDTQKPIATGYWTANGQPNFLVTLAGADAVMASIVDFDTTSQGWEVALFGKPAAMNDVPFLSVVGGGLESVENDCVPDCVNGHETYVDWAYDPQARQFIGSRSLGAPRG